MKKLLSVVAILILAGALLPVQSQAGYRGAWAPITFINSSGAPYVNGAEQGALRPGRTYTSASIGRMNAFLALTTRSLVVGSETVREMWQFLDRERAGLSFATTMAPLQVDPAATISYADPAWSPTGDWLAYVKTDKNVTYSEIWVQQYSLGASSIDVVGASVPIGSPIMVVGGGPGVINRHPAWSPDGNSLVYDSNRSGLSIDLYTQQVFPGLGSPNRITFNDAKGEITPTWSPDGTKIAYASNKFGQFLLFVLDLSTVPNPTDGVFAETNPAPVTHANPKWSWVAGEHVLYYDAPAGEDQNAPPSLWRLDLDTQAKCGFSIDARGHYQIDVSHITNTTVDGIPFNYFVFSSTATNLGLHIWKGDYITGCIPPLPMIAEFTPNNVNAATGGEKNQSDKSITVSLHFPPETQAAGYVALGNVAGPPEGIHMRTVRIQSPTIEGFEAEDEGNNSNCPAQGGCRGSVTGLPKFSNSPGGDASVNVQFQRPAMVEYLISLGLVNQPAPLHVRAYSERTGRQFSGVGYLTVSTGASGSIVRLSQNSPNPFNPYTKLTFANSKAGDVEVRIFNARGELVKTLAKQWFPMGMHTLTWDGRTEAGAGAASGVYFAVAKSNGSTDRIKMMLMK